MNMRMKFELLAPGVQDTAEADLCPKVSRSARHIEEGFRTGTKQKIIEDLLVLQDQWRQATGQGEHDMGVGRREEISRTRRDPPSPSGSLTPRAMAVPAAVVREGGTISAAGAFVGMAAQCGARPPLVGT